MACIRPIFRGHSIMGLHLDGIQDMRVRFPLTPFSDKYSYKSCINLHTRVLNRDLGMEVFFMLIESIIKEFVVEKRFEGVKDSTFEGYDNTFQCFQRYLQTATLFLFYVSQRSLLFSRYFLTDFFRQEFY